MGEGPDTKASNHGFDAGFRAVTGDAEDPDPAQESGPTVAPNCLMDLPDDMRHVATLGHERVSEFQDDDYGRLYLDQVLRLADAADL